MSNFYGLWWSWFRSRLEHEISDQDIELVSLGDIHGDGQFDYSLSITKTVEYTWSGFFGEFSWEQEFDSDLVILSGEDGPTIENQNRLTGIDGDIIETRSIGDTNGDGMEEFVTFTGGGAYYGMEALPDGFYYGDGLRGFVDEVASDIYITFGGEMQSATSLSEAAGIDGRVVKVEALGDVNGDGLADISASVGGYYGYYGYYGDGLQTDAYYGRVIDETYIVFGGKEGSTSVGLNQFGLGHNVLGVKAIGDINGDGIGDLAATTGSFHGFGESGYYGEGYYGEVVNDVVVIFGTDGGGFGSNLSLSKSLETDQRVFEVEAIDINGDGISDLAVQVGGYYGYYGDEAPGANGYYGREVEDVLLLIGGESGQVLNLGRFADDGQTARSVHDLGDINGDGFADIGIGLSGYYGSYYGSPQEPGYGYYGYYGDEIEDMLVVFGNPDGAVSASNLNKFLGTDAPVHGVTNLGDVNRDGFDDLAVASGYYGSDLLIVFGGKDGAGDTFLFNDLGLGDTHFGNVEAIGDANGDGFVDFTLRGYYGEGYYGNVLDTGSYVVYGGESALSVTAMVQDGRLAGGAEVAELGLNFALLDPDIPGLPGDVLF